MYPLGELLALVPGAELVPPGGRLHLVPLAPYPPSYGMFAPGKLPWHSWLAHTGFAEYLIEFMQARSGSLNKLLHLDVDLEVEVVFKLLRSQQRAGKARMARSPGPHVAARVAGAAARAQPWSFLPELLLFSWLSADAVQELRRPNSAATGPSKTQQVQDQANLFCHGFGSVFISTPFNFKSPTSSIGKTIQDKFSKGLVPVMPLIA